MKSLWLLDCRLDKKQIKDVTFDSGKSLWEFLAILQHFTDNRLNRENDRRMNH